MAEIEETVREDIIEADVIGNQEKDYDQMSELERENQRLREENQRLKEYRASLPPKERLYDRIPLTVKQLDMIIAGLIVLFLVVCVLGMMHH